MVVCSPGNIERRPGDRIKTDKRDAIRLARLFAAGDLRLVWVPSEEQEHLRELVRCREDLRADLMRARLRLAAFLLRRERYFPGPGERWTLRHRHWLSQQCFDDGPSRVTYADYLHAHDVLLARRELVARELEQIAPSCVWGETIARLRCLRGINTLTALALCAEIGDWRRFEHPDAIAKLRRAGPVRAQLRPDPPAGQDHQGRPPPTPAGCWSRPRCTTASRRRSAPRSRSASAARTRR
jgi:transposase